MLLTAEPTLRPDFFFHSNLSELLCGNLEEKTEKSNAGYGDLACEVQEGSFRVTQRPS